MYNFEKKMKREKFVEKRYFKWNSKNTFEWSEANIAKLLAFNDAIIKKEDELYKLLSNVKEDIDTLLASGKTYYETYDIDAYLSYEADDYSTPTGDDKTMCDVYCCTDFTLCMGLHINAGEALETVEKCFMRDTNWNYEHPFVAFPDQYKKHKITRSLHWLLEQGTYTPEDILYLNPDYFVPCIEIRN